MITGPPVDPPTNPDLIEEPERCFFYRLSNDCTHYEYVGEGEGDTFHERSCDKEAHAACWEATEHCSENIAYMVPLWWYPGEKCSVDGLPWPPTDPPPYEGFEVVKDEEGAPYQEFIPLDDEGEEWKRGTQ